MSNSPTPYNVDTKVQGQPIVYHKDSTHTHQANILDNITQQQQASAVYDTQVQQSGGENNKRRTFRIVKWNNEHISQENGGTFKGRTPADAARKVLRSHLNPLLSNGIRKFQKVNVTIMEITQGSNHREKSYIVKRVKLEKPQIIKWTNKKTGKTKKFKREYKFTVKKVKL
jgi:hypothetical protein